MSILRLRGIEYNNSYKLIFLTLIMGDNIGARGLALVERKKKLQLLLEDVSGVEDVMVYMFPKKAKNSTRLGISFRQIDPRGFLPEYLYIFFDEYRFFRNGRAKYSFKNGFHNVTVVAKPSTDERNDPLKVLAQWDSYVHRAIRHYIIGQRRG